MKLNLLMILMLMSSGCTFLYDSRGQNRLDLSNPKGKGISVDNVKLKTGRLIKINILKCEEKCEEIKG